MRIRTGYSFRTAFGHIDDVLSRLKEIGEDVAPITDRVSTFGFVKWTKAAEKLKLRPIYGVELPVAIEIGAKRPTVDMWTFIALTSLRPLHDLIYLATQQSNREAVLSYEQALAAKGLIKIAGERAQLDQMKPQKDLFIALSPSSPKGLISEALKRKFTLIASSDNYYPRKEDKELYRVALGRRANTQTYSMHILDQREWARECARLAPASSLEAAWKAKEWVALHSRATLQKATLLRPEKPKTLREMCIEGAKRTKTNLKDKVYRERLDKELALIEEKKFEDYFYIIADLIGWAKKRMLVGPARGSSCGSLVCYLLDITAIDPIPNGLIFERFIDINRSDLPDIDIDFADDKRHLVFEYAEEKYGVDRVARLGTVGTYQPRSILRAIGPALRIPKWMIDKVSQGIIERSSGDSRALQAFEDTLNDTEAGRQMKEAYPEAVIANRMEGHPNNAGQHAAGIVITERPVMDFVAVNSSNNSTMCDKEDAEYLNLLKIDALGLTQLSIFGRTMELIGREPVSGWLDTIPDDDPKAFEVLNQQHFAGIFQFNGLALQSLAKQVKVTKIDDIITLTALARPGPLASGGAGSWVKRMNGDKVTYPHKVFQPYISDTMGIVVYQEQVMQIGREVGDLTWEDVTALRKAMSKSLGKEFFDRYGDRWKKAARKKGIPDSILNEVWDDLCAYGSWAFNKSHSVAYGHVSYQSCYLKAHYPVEFAAATLDAEADPVRQIQILRELKEEGIDYIPIDPDHSIDRWTVAERDGKRLLIGPLTTIKGIGPAAMAAILDSRRNGIPLKPGIIKKLEAAKTPIDSIYPISDTIKALHPDLTAINIVSTPTPVIDVQVTGSEYNVMIFCVAQRIVPRDENEEVLIAKRGGRRIKGPTASLNLFVRDDTDEIYTKVDRYLFPTIGQKIVERGRAGKALYAIKGYVPKSFRMIKVQQIRYLGDLELGHKEAIDAEETETQTTAETSQGEAAFSDGQRTLDLWSDLFPGTG